MFATITKFFQKKKKATEEALDIPKILILEDINQEKENQIKETQEKFKEKLQSLSKQTESEMKVSVLAKLLNVKTADLIEKAKTKGIEIKSNRSVLTPDQVKNIKEKVFI